MKYEDKDNRISADIEKLFHSEVESTDYVFVVSGNGALKCVFCPSVDDNEEVPTTITDILEIFGITVFGGQPVLH